MMGRFLIVNQEMTYLFLNMKIIPKEVHYIVLRLVRCRLKAFYALRKCCLKVAARLTRVKVLFTLSSFTNYSSAPSQLN